MVVKFRSIKKEIRILGIDDGSFDFRDRLSHLVTIIGVVYRGGYWLDGVMRTEIEIDGMDATEKITSMITKSPHYNQIRVVTLNGITFAGFNIVDIQMFFKKMKLPVIAVTRDKPNLKEIKVALMNLPDYERRWRIIENAGKIIEVYTRREEKPVYMQIAGLSEADAEKILRKTSTRSNVPEALRVAHIIASGLAQLKEKEFDYR